MSCRLPKLWSTLAGYVVAYRAHCCRGGIRCGVEGEPATAHLRWCSTADQVDLPSHNSVPQSTSKLESVISSNHSGRRWSGQIEYGGYNQHTETAEISQNGFFWGNWVAEVRLAVDSRRVTKCDFHIDYAYAYTHPAPPPPSSQLPYYPCCFPPAFESLFSTQSFPLCGRLIFQLLVSATTCKQPWPLITKVIEARSRQVSKRSLQ